MIKSAVRPGSSEQVSVQMFQGDVMEKSQNAACCRHN